MTLAAPQMLWLIPALGLPLVGFFWWAWRRRQQLITQFISARLINQLKVGVSTARQKLRMALMVVVVALLVFALARPQWGTTEEEARQRGLDIVVAVDTSNSMLAEDVPPNRLARAKLAALDLVHRAKTDRMGLVAFAGTAFLECPLTLDDAAFSQSVDSLDTRTISQGGTAIAGAINEARKAFKQESDNHKVLVLFTDGEDHDSDAVPAAQKAAEEGMIIFTVGIGTPDGELLRIRDERGRTDYIRDEQGQPVESHLNEELLQQIAAATKGFYLHLSGTKTMDLLYDRGIAPLPKSENSVRLFQRYRERFHWPLAAAMLLLILEMFLPDRKRRKRPAAATATPASAGALTETVAILLLLAIPAAAWGGGASQAFRDYNQGKFDDAFKDYNQLLERKKDDPRLNFNAGAAAYQGKKLDEAVKQFNEALKSPDLDLQQRAYYNLANSYYRMGEQNQDTAKKQEAWENALKQYTNALALNKQDPDAGFNRDFVQRQIEELKKQQSQSQSQADKQKQDQKKDDKQDQKNQNDSKQDKQDSQSKQNQDQSKSDQNSQAQNQPKDKADQDKQKNDQSQAQNQPDKKDQADQKKDTAQNKAGDQSKDKPSDEQQREAAMMAAGEMTPQQAAQLLDAQKDDEQVLRLAPPNKNVSQPRSFKNW